MRCTQKVHFSMTPREPHGDIRVEDQVFHEVVMGILKPIEPAHLVRTIVGAVTRSHTAIVNLLVKAFIVVHRRQDGADHLAGRVAAVLAQHWLEQDVHSPLSFRVIAIQTQPVHVAPAPHLVLADDRNVVLDLAGDNTGRATRTGIEVDDHAPVNAMVRMILGPQVVMLLGRRSVRLAGQFLIGLQCQFADDRRALLARRGKAAPVP